MVWEHSSLSKLPRQASSFTNVPPKMVMLTPTSRPQILFLELRKSLARSNMLALSQVNLSAFYAIQVLI